MASVAAKKKSTAPAEDGRAPAQGGPDQAPGGLHMPQHQVRVVTAAALFDGHDAAINVMRDTAHDSFAASKTLKSSARNALERGKRL